MHCVARLLLPAPTPLNGSISLDSDLLTNQALQHTTDIAALPPCCAAVQVCCRGGRMRLALARMVRTEVPGASLAYSITLDWAPPSHHIKCNMHCEHVVMATMQARASEGGGRRCVCSAEEACRALAWVHWWTACTVVLSVTAAGYNAACERRLMKDFTLAILTIRACCGRLGR